MINRGNAEGRKRGLIIFRASAQPRFRDPAFRPMTLRSFGLSICLLLPLRLRAADTPRSDWIDPDTGHRVIRLSTEPGSSTLYFHDNAYSESGDKLIFASPGGIALVDLT